MTSIPIPSGYDRLMEAFAANGHTDVSAERPRRPGLLRACRAPHRTIRVSLGPTDDAFSDNGMRIIRTTVLSPRASAFAERFMGYASPRVPGPRADPRQAAPARGAGRLCAALQRPSSARAAAAGTSAARAWPRRRHHDQNRSKPPQASIAAFPLVVALFWMRMPHSGENMQVSGPRAVLRCGTARLKCIVTTRQMPPDQPRRQPTRRSPTNLSCTRSAWPTPSCSANASRPGRC